MATSNQRWDRRQFVKAAGALCSPWFAFNARPAVAEAPPETTRLTLVNDGTTCIAPVFVAEALLGSEGFSDVRYIKAEGLEIYARTAAGDADISLAYASAIVKSLDAGKPLLVLAGIHPGCF